MLEVEPKSAERGHWLRNEVRAQVSLAWPILASQIASIGAAFSDVVMAGMVSTATLAGVAIGSSVLVIVMFAMAGFFLGFNTLVAQLAGSRKGEDIGEICRQALWMAPLVGGIGAGICIASARVLPLMRLGHEVLESSSAFLYVISSACPAYCAYRVLQGHSSSTGHTKPIMVVAFASLVINVLLNWIFMLGGLGFAPLGAAGCAAATSISTWAGLFMMSRHTIRAVSYGQSSPFSRFSWPSLRAFGRIAAIGWPISVSYVAEGSTFTVMTAFVAALGTEQIAAHHIGLNVNSLVFMIPMSMCVAITTRVGQALGSGDLALASRRGRIGVGICTASAGCIAIAGWVFAGSLTSLYSPDPQTQALAEGIVKTIAVLQLFDAVQSALAAFIRSYTETASVMYIQTLSFWIIALPLGFILSRSGWLLDLPLATNMGARGLWVGLGVGLAGASIGLAVLARKVSRPPAMTLSEV